MLKQSPLGSLVRLESSMRFDVFGRQICKDRHVIFDPDMPRLDKPLRRRFHNRIATSRAHHLT